MGWTGRHTLPIWEDWTISPRALSCFANVAFVVRITKRVHGDMGFKEKEKSWKASRQNRRPTQN